MTTSAPNIRVPDKYRESVDPADLRATYDLFSDFSTGRRRLAGIEKPSIWQIVPLMEDALPHLSQVARKRVIFRILSLKSLYDEPRLARWVRKNNGKVRAHRDLLKQAAITRLTRNGDFPIDAIVRALDDKVPEDNSVKTQQAGEEPTTYPFLMEDSLNVH